MFLSLQQFEGLTWSGDQVFTNRWTDYFVIIYWLTPTMTHSTDALFLHYTTSYNRHVRSWDGHVVKGLLCYPAPNKEELKNRAVFVCLFPGVAYPWQPIFPGGFTFLAMWQQEDWSPWIQIWPILFIFCQVTRIFLVDFFFLICNSQRDERKMKKQPRLHTL